MKQPIESFPLFKGATRLPTIAGVPIMPLLFMFVIVASMAMLFGVWWWFMVLPSWFIMAQITKNDDKAFRIWWLWGITCLRNGSTFWGASTYSRSDYRKRSRR